MLKLVPPRPGKTPFWYIRGTFAGRTYDASTKARDKATARKFKERFELEVAKSDALKRAPATFGQAAALYLDYRRPRKAWRKSIDRLTAILGDTLLSDIRQHDLVRVATELFPKAQPPTRNKEVMTPAAAVLHYAAENDLCPYIRVRKFKEKRPEARARTKEEAEVLIANADPRMRRLLIFLFCQGWRISDALRLRWQDIDFSTTSVRYYVSKTDEWRVMPLHMRVAEMLAAETDKMGRVFHWYDKSKVYKALRPLCKRVGIKFTPHQARHSFATWLVNEGVSLAEHMEAGGWRDHKSVLRYGRVDQDRARAVINRIKT